MALISFMPVIWCFPSFADVQVDNMSIVPIRPFPSPALHSFWILFSDVGSLALTAVFTSVVIYGTLIGLNLGSRQQKTFTGPVVNLQRWMKKAQALFLGSTITLRQDADS